MDPLAELEGGQDGPRPASNTHPPLRINLIQASSCQNKKKLCQKHHPKWSVPKVEWRAPSSQLLPCCPVTRFSIKKKNRKSRFTPSSIKRYHDHSSSSSGMAASRPLPPWRSSHSLLPLSHRCVRCTRCVHGMWSTRRCRWQCHDVPLWWENKEGKGMEFLVVISIWQRHMRP